MVTFHCRYCHEQTGPVPFPKTDMEQFWLRAFMQAHEGCGVSAVEAVKLPDRTQLRETRLQEEQTPVTLRHEHEFLARCPTADKQVFVEDCACGARRRVQETLGGGRSVIDENVVVEGGSLSNAVLTMQPGGPPVDRWRP